MSYEPHDELLSAYLDGELTADEKARVARLLANDPAARRRLDELRVVSAAVQGLPKLTLGEDLSDRVLRLAERQILAGPADAKTSDTKPVAPAEASWRRLGRRLLTPRTLVWPGVAVVVAILLMLYNPGGEHVAKNAAKPKKNEPVVGADDKPRGEPALPVISPVPEAAASSGYSTKHGVSRRDEKRDFEGVKIDESGRADVAKKLDNMTAFESPPAGPSKMSAANSPVLSEPATRPVAKPDETRDTMEKTMSRKGGSGFDNDAKLRYKSKAGRYPVADAEKPAAPRPNAKAPEYAGKGGPGGMGVMGGMGAGNKGGLPPSDNNDNNWTREPNLAQNFKGLNERGPVAEAPVLIVRCELTPEAAQKDLFAKVLTGNRIEFTDELVDLKQLAGDTKQRQVAQDGSGGVFTPMGKIGTLHTQPRREVGKRGKDYNKNQSELEEFPQRGQKAEQVLVEATWEQIEGTLDEINRKPKMFLSLVAEPTPGASAQVPRSVESYNYRSFKENQLKQAVKKLEKRAVRTPHGRAQRLPADMPELSAQLAQSTVPSSVQTPAVNMPVQPIAPSFTPAPGGPPPTSSAQRGSGEAYQHKTQARQPEEHAASELAQSGPALPSTPLTPQMGFGGQSAPSPPAAGVAAEQSARQSQSGGSLQSLHDAIPQTAADTTIYRVLFLLEVVSPARAAASVDTRVLSRIQAASPAEPGPTPSPPPKASKEPLPAKARE
ncbi:MAG: hypothetical protein JW818_01235 [Pirellulales bacterium]|nr:hypothetical protein [Pirellulales bacterium]